VLAIAKLVENSFVDYAHVSGSISWRYEIARID